MKTLIVSFVAIATIALTSFGQAPEGFKYQAVVRDAANTILVNQAVGMRLTIQEGAIGGPSVYTETFAPSTNAYGLVNLEIGTGTTTDDFTLIDWANGPFYIETAADVTGGTSYIVMGTSQLMSVPYALYAKTSGNGAGPVGPAGNDGANGPQGITGNDGAAGATGANGIDGIDGAVGTAGAVGPVGATGLTGANGTNGAQGPAGNDGIGIAQTLSVSGSDLTISGGNTIALPSDNDWTVNGNDIYSANSGNVGIRTASPQGAFEVYSQPQPSNAVIDQSQTTSTGGAGGFSNWQSFTAGVSGALTQVDLRVRSGLVGSSQNGTIKIYQGSGIGGTLLTTENVVFQYVSNGVYQQFPLSGMPTLTAGLQYTIRFEISAITVSWVDINTNNPYSGGQANNPSWDYLFKTYVASINPEESTLVVVDGNVGVGNITPVRSLHVNDVLRLEPRATAPSAAAAGDMYFSSVTNKLMVHDGSIWNACW
jgi:hypothetical protein